MLEYNLESALILTVCIQWFEKLQFKNFWLLKQIYLADFDFALTFSKSTIIKTFDQSGFLLDNGLKDIMKSIMENN